MQIIVRDPVLLMLFGRVVGEGIILAIRILMVIGGALTIILRLPTLSLSTWLVLLVALLVHTISSSFLLLLFERLVGEDINLTSASS